MTFIIEFNKIDGLWYWYLYIPSNSLPNKFVFLRNALIYISNHLISISYDGNIKIKIKNLQHVILFKYSSPLYINFNTIIDYVEFCEEYN